MLSRSFTAFTLAATMVAAGSYLNAQSSTSPGSSSTPQTSGSQTSGSQSSGSQASNDSARMMVQQMMEANAAEIQLGQLAATHASSPQVKTYAQTMVTDHTQNQQQLQMVAQQLGIQSQTAAMPNAEHKAIAQRLSGLQGADFDREYMKAMVTAHQQAERDLRPFAEQGLSGGQGRPSSSAASGSNTAVTQYASMTLSKVQQHLKEAEDLQKNVSK